HSRSSCHSYALYFFFSSRRRHTRFDCDWSSDVCSSDLFRYSSGFPLVIPVWQCHPWVVGRTGLQSSISTDWIIQKSTPRQSTSEIGRASCRERVEVAVGCVSVTIR